MRQMGVHVRSVAPGFAGTNRHFHTVEEEWAYVLSGRGKLRIGPLTLPVGPGQFAGFPPGPSPHHFVNDGDEDLVFLEGGESRAADDGCWYPDARLMSQGRQLVEPYQEPPPEQGTQAQLQAIESLPVQEFSHDVEPRARRQMRVLHRPTGLTCQAVYWCRVAQGELTTALHTHDRTDEWVFVLDGKGFVRIGDDEFPVGPQDFVGHPAGGEPHVMRAETDLTYLMGGMIDPLDVVTYPEHGLRRLGGKLEPLSPEQTAHDRDR
jgi:quercetin 2,3-dioxygenase